jgi:broad specificity phosphatase PhoE
MTETIFGLLRHGQTDWNIDFRLQGITDIPLNETGILQAEEAARVLTATHWDAVITSPLSRARDTALIVGKAIGHDEIGIEDRLLERSFGEAEGLMHSEWRERYPDQNQVPGAETLDDLRIRSNELLDFIAEKYAGQKVLGISHGALIRKLVRIVSDGEFPREGERFGNACMCVFVHSQGKWSIKRYDPRTLALETHSDLS